MSRLFLVNRYFHPDLSPTSVLATEVAEHLAQRHCVQIVCSRQELENPRADLPSSAQHGNLRIRRVASTSLGRTWLPGRAVDYATFLLSAAFWLLVWLRRGDVVIAKTDPPLLGVVVAAAAHVRRATFVNWFQDVYPETAWRLGIGSERSATGRILRAFRNWSLRSAKLNVAISAGMGRYLREEARIPSPVVIPNWAEDPGRDEARTGLRHELKLEGRFVVGYSGNLGRAHPVEPLLALADAFRDDARIHFLFTGGGANLQRLREIVTARGISNWSFLPYLPRERLADLLATADVHLTLLDPQLECFILPSKVYGILAAGRPVVHIGDVRGEVAELLRSYDCGWSMERDDAAGTVDLLRRLAVSPDKLRETGANARAAFERNHSRSKALSSWELALAPLLSSVADRSKSE